MAFLFLLIFHFRLNSALLYGYCFWSMACYNNCMSDMKELRAYACDGGICLYYMKNNMHLYSRDYYEYTEFLSGGITYSILISKRLLMQPMLPIWLFFLGLFSISSPVFFAMVGLPCLVLLCVFIALIYPVWNTCEISPKAYILFHTLILFLLKIISIPLSMFLEALWTFYI